MSLPSPLAKLALRRLADAEPEIVAPDSRDTDAAVLAIARELDEIRARRRRRRFIATSFALAATIVIAIGAVRALRPARDGAVATEVSDGVLIMRGDDGTTLARGGAVAKGDRVVASAAGKATLVLRRGTELRANGGADLVVAEYGPVEIFDLRAGSIELHVAKLESGERFVIRTADAEVEVRGTQFRVDVGARCAGTTTHVKVTEGVVVVRHAGSETRVAANESWPAECVASALPPPAPPPPASPPPASPPPASPPPASATTIALAPQAASQERPLSTPAHATATASAAAAGAPLASSDLAEQNRLYAEAMSAKRRGDAATALGALDRLLASHPRGPLAESAYVERMRILAASDPTRAADAARTYLARHPNGYARDEARKLAGEQ